MTHMHDTTQIWFFLERFAKHALCVKLKEVDSLREQLRREADEAEVKIRMDVKMTPDVKEGLVWPRVYVYLVKNEGAV